MKFLFDQNISSRILKLLQHQFADIKHVKFEGMVNAKDLEIWAWAKINGYCIITFDADFLDIFTLKGFPPKIIYLQTGNKKTREIARIFLERVEIIETFIQSTDIGGLKIQT